MLKSRVDRQETARAPSGVSGMWDRGVEERYWREVVLNCHTLGLPCVTAVTTAL